MYTERSGKQNRLEMVVLEELVPQDHLLRKIDAVIDFSFINKICKPYYCENNGRPAIEPEVLFRMLFIGYLYGIRSEIRLLKEIEVNVPKCEERDGIKKSRWLMKTLIIIARNHIKLLNIRHFTKQMVIKSG